MHGGVRPRAGRKPAHIDLIQLEKLCALQCTDEELADCFGVSTRTIEKRRHNPEFAEAMRRGRVRGRISVRRAQMKLLEAGNSTLAVWLGKQLLGQRENVQLSGPSGGPIQVSNAREELMARLTRIRAHLEGAHRKDDEVVVESLPVLQKP